MRISRKLPLAVIAAMSLLMAVAAASASAKTTVSELSGNTGPQWKIVSVSAPTNFKPGDKSGDNAILVTATNVGGSAAGCTLADHESEVAAHLGAVCPADSPVANTITIGDVLPAGLTAVEVFGVNSYHSPLEEDTGTQQAGPPVDLSCMLSPGAPSCTVNERVDPGDTVVLTIRVNVESVVEGSGEVNSASVSGGGAPSASTSDAVTVSMAAPPYGVARGSLMAAASTSQAGGHPNVTNEFFLNTINLLEGNTLEDLLSAQPVSLPKDVRFDLPPGLVGTTVGMPTCTMADVIDEANCAQNTMVGTATLIVMTEAAGRFVFTVPVYNIAPAPGEPVAFAFNALFFPVRLDTNVLSDGEYNVRVTAPDITAGAKTYGSIITIWGVPAEHNAPGPDTASRTPAGSRYLEDGRPRQITFGGNGVEEYGSGAGAEETEMLEKRVPLLTNPSQCSIPLTGVLETDSWAAPLAEDETPKELAPMGMGTGCGQLSFKPSVSMLPDTLEAGAPAGYSFDLSLPQNTEAEGLATPDVKRTSVTLPLGTVISPSAADGLGVCTSEQFDLHSGVPGDCPRESQVGTVRSKTPALEEALTGAIYLASPECTGAIGVCTPQDASDGHMIRLFLQLVGEGESGIVVKQELTGEINQQTGQLTVVDDEVPQVPFSDLKLTLQGGERATLANPRSCGTATTTADLTPWSTPFTPDGTPESKFDIDENCFGAQFDPSFTAGTTSNQAGGFTPFTVAFGRSDSDEFLNGLQVQMPPGLLGMLSRVSLCPEPQASQGTCGPESQIGEVTVETGPGADPFVVRGGKVFITGPYKGAPYGLSIVVPAKAGPYTLAGTTGNGTVVNRSAISVNPETSALTVTADPLPTVLDGIPLQLRLVNVTINRAGFIFNSTSCDKFQIGATLTSTEAASASGSSSYQVTNCGALAFKPKFTVSTSGKTSRANGASLDAKVTFPTGSQTNQANIHSFKVELPKQLPSRLTTLQKACSAATFDANPANCPPASVIGVVRVNTPVVPVQLTGPVYFVSHGGEAFPSLEIVLQGDGVRVDVVASTFISKAGITSSTFKTVPDVPFESFELYLPEGPYSALTTDGDLCTSKLAMPTAIVAQNGAEIHESTPIGVTACPKAKKATTKKKKSKASRARKSSHGRGGKS